MKRECDVAVIGGGPAGLTAAVALASAGVETVLISKAPPFDNRTTALLSGSVAALEAIAAWPLCAAHAAPLTAIRIIDDTSRLLRAPEVMFEAAEIGLDAFGYNIENHHLLAALDKRARELGALQWIPATATAIELNDEVVTIRLDGGGATEARLIVAADGRKSLCRETAGIGMRRHGYPQAALTLNLSHTRPHDGISTEFHTESGPFTLVPLPGPRSSLVCVLDPEAAEELGACDVPALSEEIERRAHSILGKMSVEDGRGVFPLAIETAESFGRDRIALVGEAAHVIPPIGAQGLNLGLRDAATVAELVVEARQTARDVGGRELLAEYDRMRRTDVTGRTAAVDLLNRSLLSDFLPVQGARGLALYLLDRIAPLRRAVMREGVEPAAQPRLMRGEAL